MRGGVGVVWFGGAVESGSGLDGGTWGRVVDVSGRGAASVLGVGE